LQLAQPLQTAAAMVRLVLLAALVLVGSSARADDGDSPGLVLARAASDPLPRWEVHLGGGVGAARAVMLGSDHRAVAASIDLEAIRWLDRDSGLGLYLGEIVAVPWTQVEMDGHPVVRDLPFIVEPELVHRSVSRRARWLATGWTASLGAGMVLTRTSENWGHLLSHHAYEKTLEHGVEAGTTAQLTAFVHAGPLAVAVGPRASVDTAGDVAIGLEATAGASW
jgi:hypothetical protein